MGIFDNGVALNTAAGHAASPVGSQSAMPSHGTTSMVWAAQHNNYDTPVLDQQLEQ